MSVTESDIKWVKKSLSVPRFTPYVRRCGGDEATAVHLYWWNIEVSAAFYAALQCLEVVLRNALHEELTFHYARSDWWAAAEPAGAGAYMLADARRMLSRTIGRVPNADDIVAAVPFGFWVSLLSRTNEAAMWRPALYRAFRPGYRGSRTEMHTHLDYLRTFRNRIMHHEPVHHRYLVADHNRIHELLEYLAPGAPAVLSRVDTVAEVLARRPELFGGRG